jgi:hypothetical protein
MPPAAASTARRLLWGLALAIVVLLPLWPSIDILVLSARAAAHGCKADLAAPCIVNGVALGPKLQSAIEAATASAQLLGVGVFLWLALCFFILNRVTEHLWWRIGLALALTFLLTVLPIAAPHFAISGLLHDGCPKPHHMMTLPCQLLGVDMGRPMRELASVGLILLISPLLAVITFIAYVALQTNGQASLRRTLGTAAFWVVAVILWPITLVTYVPYVIWRRWRAPSA